MDTGWLPSVLRRGADVDPTRPWRAPDRAGTDRDLRAGVLRRVVGDVVVAADVQVDAPLRARALALLLPPGAVVLGAAALWVHLGHPLTSPTEVLLCGRRLPPVPAGTGLRFSLSRRRPDPSELTTLGPLTLTVPARGLLDVAAVHPHRAERLRAALTAAGLLDESAVQRASDLARGRAHVRTARRALALPRDGRRAGALSPSAGARP
ncbi:hypothetical protein [Kineococcus sp. SYSU DK002]|uniref:hypothetical protein n=1 Tax=Kineococcus sp. SYSU DK002 TaxID=3383123 RepID=UPI003D7EFFCD